VLGGAMISMGRTLEKLGPALYSAECVEVEFCELRLAGVLGSLGLRGYRKSRVRQSGRGPSFAGLWPLSWLSR
jgi:hypothetical protein